MSDVIKPQILINKQVVLWEPNMKQLEMPVHRIGELNEGKHWEAKLVMHNNDEDKITKNDYQVYFSKIDTEEMKIRSVMLICNKPSTSAIRFAVSVILYAYKESKEEMRISAIQAQKDLDFLEEHFGKVEAKSYKELVVDVNKLLKDGGMNKANKKS